MSRATGKNGQPEERFLVHETRRIPYRLHFRKRRSLGISVTPELIVNVFAPVRAPDAWIEDTIRERGEWILRTLEKVAGCELLALPERCSTGDTIRYLGRAYRLALIEGRRNPPELLFDTLVISMPNAGDALAAGRAVGRWYRARANEILQRSMRTCLRSAVQHGIKEPVLAVRDMRSRWGSCSSNGRVTLNLKLVMVPQACVDYVVMHELCHLVHHNHGKRYYSLLAACMPDWKERKKALDEYRLK